MPKRFYAAWAFVVILAAVLPVAIPYFIWPPYEYERGSFGGPDQGKIFGRYAQSRVLLAKYVPNSVSVEANALQANQPGCGPLALHQLQRDNVSTVKLVERMASRSVRSTSHVAPAAISVSRLADSACSRGLRGCLE